MKGALRDWLDVMSVEEAAEAFAQHRDIIDGKLKMKEQQLTDYERLIGKRFEELNEDRVEVTVAISDLITEVAIFRRELEKAKKEAEDEREG